MVLIERPQIMTFEQSEKPGLKRKFAHEFKESAWIFLNLVLVRCALATYSTLFLHVGRTESHTTLPTVRWVVTQVLEDSCSCQVNQAATAS